MKITLVTGARRAVMIAVLVSASGCATVANRPEAASNSIWVCHGGRTPKWQRVSASAEDGHTGHGDRVSRTPQVAGEACG